MKKTYMQFNSIQKKSLKASSNLLRAITHPLRISMVNFIRINQPVKVHDIHTGLKLEQSITSQHLRILRDAGIVKTVRDGKNIYYHLKSEELFQTAKSILKFDKKTLDSRKEGR